MCSFIREKILKFVMCSIDCEQSPYFFTFIEGSGFSHARGHLRLLRVFLDGPMPAV